MHWANQLDKHRKLNLVYKNCFFLLFNRWQPCYFSTIIIVINILNQFLLLFFIILILIHVLDILLFLMCKNINFLQMILNDNL